MRILFAAYCVFARERTESLIGVYKRCLRIGLEMRRRGHDVWILCPGRQNYRDETVAEAEASLLFLDLPQGLFAGPTAAFRRSYHRVLFARLKLDLVVIGERPFGGNLHDAAVSAASFGIRTVVLDNVYQKTHAEKFLKDHGAMFDGVVLCGLRAAQPDRPPPHYCGVPPYIEGACDEADRLLSDQGPATPLITVLGYDRRAEELAAALLERISQESFRAIFLSPDPQGCRQRLQDRGVLSSRVLVLSQPGENLLFGLIKRARMVIGKCGFMQASESLALGTPFLGIHYVGCLPLWTFKGDAAKYFHALTSVTPDSAAVAAARRFLRTPPEALRGLEEKRLGSRAMVAEFLETLPVEPRAATTQESAALGYTPALLQNALANRHPGLSIQIRSIRCLLLHESKRGRIDSVVCRYLAGGAARNAVLWGRMYASSKIAKEEIAKAADPFSGRRPLYASAGHRILLEEDLGELGPTK